MKTSNPFFSHHHLSDEGVSLYVDALKLFRTKALPDDVIDHAETCESCKARIVELDSTLPQEMYDAAAHHPYFDRKIHEPAFHILYPAYRVAAVLAGAALVGVGYYFIVSQTEPQPAIVQQQTPSHVVSKPIPPPDQAKGKNQEAAKTDDVLAANFTTSPNLEDLVQNNFRSTSITATSPVVGKVTSQPITFRWKNYDEPVTLEVLNNKEAVVASVNVHNTSWTMKDKLAPGLYYWKLESDDDLLYVGKFIVH